MTPPQRVSKVDAQKKAAQLYADLKRIAERDPEQEVRGIALPVLDACLAAIRDVASKDPVATAIRDVVSPEAALDFDESLRAVDAMIVVGQLIAIIGKPPRKIALD